MNAKRLLAAVLAIGMCGRGCAKSQGQHPAASAKSGVTVHAEHGDPAEPGETKIRLDQAPASVRQTIQRELVGAELEDIAKEDRHGKTVYETDIIRQGQKWEIVVGEDGQIISKTQENEAEEERGEGKEKAEAKGAGWRENFDVRKSDLAATGNNPWLTIQPGRVLKLRHGNDALTVTILNDTKAVDGVKCGVLEEREEKNGRLIEVSHNYFATDPSTGDVYYFGEDVDNYKDGKLVDHESGWLAGEKGGKFGLMMPGKPKQGDKFYQEWAPKVAMDRVEIVSTDETVKTPAGTFEHCVHLRETTPLEGDVSHKYYAPNVGIIKDDEFELADKP
jgi:hypothetical protein